MTDTHTSNEIRSLAGDLAEHTKEAVTAYINAYGWPDDDQAQQRFTEHLTEWLAEAVPPAFAVITEERTG